MATLNRCVIFFFAQTQELLVCLEGLENILKVGETDKNLGSSSDGNVYAQMIDEVEDLEKIKNLQSHDNSEIYEKAIRVLGLTGWKRRMMRLEQLKLPKVFPLTAAKVATLISTWAKHRFGSQHNHVYTEICHRGSINQHLCQQNNQ